MDAKHTPNEKLPHPPARASSEYLELWLSICKHDWGSLVLVPADREGSTAEIANNLADVGQRLSYQAVTAINVTSLEYGSALALADLQQHMNRERRNSAGTAVSTSADGARGVVGSTRPAGADASDASAGGATPELGSRPAAPATTTALAVVPPARLIISLPPVVTEPLGLAAAHEADAVILVIRMNRARMAEVRRTIELVGRDRVLGSFIVR